MKRTFIFLAAGLVVGGATVAQFASSAPVAVEQGDTVTLNCPTGVPAGQNADCLVAGVRKPTTTTSTTLAPTTTTAAPTTTRAPTTTAAPTTTTAPPTGAQFFEDFSNPTAFADRFIEYAGNFIDNNGHRTDTYLRNGGDTPAVVHADHDMACGDPNATHRDLDVRDPDTTRYFFQCAPGGDPTKAHLMTAFDTSGYALMSFSPNRSFTNVSKVCWDINATEEGGGKWTNMAIVAEADYQLHPGRLDYVTPGFNNEDGLAAPNLQDGEHPTPVWGIRDFRGGQHQYWGDDDIFDDYIARTTTDRAARFQHCVFNDPAGGATLTVARPGGEVSRYHLPRAIPTGQVRVIFQDDMYDPPKRDLYAPEHVTWHWDNILIQ